MPKTKSTRKPSNTQDVYTQVKRPHKKRTPKTGEATAASPNSLQSAVPPPAIHPPPGPDTGAVLFRTLCLENVLRRYPELEIRSDYDLLQLSSRHYKGTPAEIYAEVDEMLAHDVEENGYDFTMEACKKTLAMYVEPTGIKPEASTSACDNKFVFIRPIPETKYSIRLFPGSLSAAEYCLDFVETATGNPVNSPFEYELWGVPNPDADTPWLSIPMCGKLRSIERVHGIKQADILLGEEKYILRDGQTCVLVRPGKQSIRFTVPVRKVKQPEGVVDDMHVLDLPRYIEP